MPAPAVGAGLAQVKTAVSRVASLLRDMGWSVLLSWASSFISLVFNLDNEEFDIWANLSLPLPA